MDDSNWLGQGGGESLEEAPSPSGLPDAPLCSGPQATHPRTGAVLRGGGSLRPRSAGWERRRLQETAGGVQARATEGAG